MAFLVPEWLSDVDVFVRQCGVPAGERAVVLVDYLGGCAKEEVLCHPDEVRRDFGAHNVSLLRRVFRPRETRLVSSRFGIILCQLLYGPLYYVRLIY